MRVTRSRKKNELIGIPGTRKAIMGLYARREAFFFNEGFKKPRRSSPSEQGLDEIKNVIGKVRRGRFVVAQDQFRIGCIEDLAPPFASLEPVPP